VIVSVDLPASGYTLVIGVAGATYHGAIKKKCVVHRDRIDEPQHDGPCNVPC
jgi:hypothetical protein